jgi:hypothetical protein
MKQIIASPFPAWRALALKLENEKRVSTDLIKAFSGFISPSPGNVALESSRDKSAETPD